MTKTNAFHTTRAVKPAGENSQFISKEVNKAVVTLEIPLARNSIFRVLASFPSLKIRAMNIKDNPIPPQPYISSAQANEPGLAIVKTGRIVAVSGGLLVAR